MQGGGSKQPIAIVLSLVALAACAGRGDGASTIGEGSASPDDAATTTVEAADGGAGSSGDGRFADVGLAVDTAAQLDRVGLVGLDPTEVDGLIAAYEFAGGDWWGSRILVDADGPYLLAPIFPSDPGSGGELVLRLSDGDHVGPPLPLTVTAMATAPGSFEAAIGSLRTAVGEMAGTWGSSWDDLAATSPADTSVELAPLKLVQLLLDDGTEASAAGAFAALPPDDAALLDAIFAQVDLPGALDPAGFSAVAPFLPEQIATPDDTPDDSSAQGFAGPRAFAPVVARRQGAGCIPFPQEGDGQVSAQRLSEMMIGSAFSDIAINPEGAPGRTFAALEVTVTLGSVLEAGATGGETHVYDTFGKAAGSWKMFNAMRAGLLPSSFTRIQVGLSPGDLEEDRPVSDPGTWPSVRVTASSTGYSLDGDIAGELAGAFGGKLMGTRLPKSEVGEVDEAIDWFHKLDDAVDVTDVNSAAGGEPIKQAVGAMLPADGVVTFCPQEFTADIAGADWSWARRDQNLLTVDNEAQTYVNTTAIGPDTLKIGPIPAKFGQHSIYALEPVETKAIDVRIEPDKVYVTRPGDPVDITATIKDAYNTKLGWYADKGEWAGGGGALETDDGGTQTLTTPGRAEDFPFRVDVESLSRTNLRQDGTPPRYDFVMVDVAPFTVTPDPGNVTVEEQIPFRALDAEGDPIAVEWRATGGTITSGPSPTAVYTAGNHAGTFTVTARLPDHPDVEVTVTVHVGDRDCILGNWELDVPAFVAAMNRFSDGGSATYLSGDSQVIVRADGTATWVMNDVKMRMIQEGQSFTLIWNSTVDNSYSLDGGLYNGGGGTATLNLYVEELGRGIDMTVPSAIGSTATYDCEPRERLVVHTEDGDLFFTYNGPA